MGIEQAGLSEEVARLVSFNDEVQLLSWSESSSGGAKIVFQLPSSESLDPFRNKGLGKKAGQRYRCVLVEIGDDERPVTKEQRSKIGPLCKLAAMWGTRADFQHWLGVKFPDTVMAAREALAEGFAPISEEDVAAEVVRMVCNVPSRRDIDGNETAEHLFHTQIRMPFSKALGE